MYRIVVAPSNRLAYEVTPNKESQKNSNDILLEDDEDSDGKEETIDQPDIKHHIGNLLNALFQPFKGL